MQDLLEFQLMHMVGFVLEKDGNRVAVLDMRGDKAEGPFRLDLVTLGFIELSKFQSFTFDGGRLVYSFREDRGMIWHPRDEIPSGCVDGLEWIENNIFKRLDVKAGGRMIKNPDTERPGTKDTNPKDAVGTKKAPMSTVPLSVLMEVGVGMMEGARKYGRHNYRVAGIRGSVYFDATMRHLMSWFEGEDIDPDSGLNHITKAICSLVVMRDGMIQDKFIDDRPPKSKLDKNDLQRIVDEIFERHPKAIDAYLEGDQNREL